MTTTEAYGLLWMMSAAHVERMHVGRAADTARRNLRAKLGRSPRLRPIVEPTIEKIDAAEQQLMAFADERGYITPDVMA